MLREMLIQHGESETDCDLLAATLNNLTGEYLSDDFETVGEYTMVTRIPHRIDLQKIKTGVESLGFIVWLVIEPNKSGHHEIVYEYKDAKGRTGINVHDKFVERQYALRKSNR